MIGHEIQEGVKSSYFNSTVAACMLNLIWWIYLLIPRTNTIAPSAVPVENHDLFGLCNVHTEKQYYVSTKLKIYPAKDIFAIIYLHVLWNLFPN